MERLATLAEQRNADHVRCDGRHVRLAPARPVHLYIVAPWLDGEVLPKSVANRPLGHVVQTDGASHTGCESVATEDGVGVDRAAIGHLQPNAERTLLDADDAVTDGPDASVCGRVKKCAHECCSSNTPTRTV